MNSAAQAPESLSFIAAYVKFMDAYTTVLIVVMLYYYASTLIYGFAESPVTPRSRGGTVFAKRLLASVVVGWTANLVNYGNYAYVYWIAGVDPEFSVANHAVRFFYINLTMIASSMHIATGLLLDGGWRMFIAGLISLGVVLSVLYGLLEIGGIA